MANNKQEQLPEILQLGQKMGLGVGSSRIRSSMPVQMGNAIPSMGEISFMNRKMDQETPGSGPVSQLRKLGNKKRRPQGLL